MLYLKKTESQNGESEPRVKKTESLKKTEPRVKKFNIAEFKIPQITDYFFAYPDYRRCCFLFYCFELPGPN